MCYSTVVLTSLSCRTPPTPSCRSPPVPWWQIFHLLGAGTAEAVPAAELPCFIRVVCRTGSYGVEEITRTGLGKMTRPSFKSVFQPTDGVIQTLNINITNKRTDQRRHELHESRCFQVKCFPVPSVTHHGNASRRDRGLSNIGYSFLYFLLSFSKLGYAQRRSYENSYTKD